MRGGSLRGFKLEALRLIKIRGVSYAQASQDLGVHQSQLRSWVKAQADDPQHAFPGHGQMKPEQLEIAQLKREVATIFRSVQAAYDRSATGSTRNAASERATGRERTAATSAPGPS